MAQLLPGGGPRPRASRVAALGRCCKMLGKLFSLLVAILLWFFVNAGERETEVLQVPVELRNVPPNVVLVSPRVDSITVRLRGPRTLLATLDGRRAPVISTFRRSSSAARCASSPRRDDPVPRGVRILDVEPRASRSARGDPAGDDSGAAGAGRRAADGSVDTVKVAPATWSSSGPASTDQGRRDRAVRSGRHERRPAAGRRPGAPRARVCHASWCRRRSRSSRNGSRTTPSVPVVVRNADRPFARPTRVEITVRGPRWCRAWISIRARLCRCDAAGGRGAHGEPEVTCRPTLSW